MLERTAASLESCSLQRVLIKPGRSSKRCRRLHSGFWQHGASAIELSSTWPTATRGKEADRVSLDQADPPLQTGLLSSALLLDFLYPRGTYALLRRLYPALPRLQDSGKTAGAVQPRSFSSHVVAADTCPSVASSRRGETGDRGRNPMRHYASMSDVKVAGDLNKSVSNTKSTSIDPDQPDSTAIEHDRPDRKTHSHKLADLLARPKDALYHAVWDSYDKSDQQQKQNFRSDVVVYLSTSRSMVDIGRAISLLRQIPSQSWNDEIQASGILLHLRAGVMTAALDVFNTGLETRRSGAGFQHLLEDALTKKEWTIVLKAWLDNFSIVQNASSTPLGQDKTQVPPMSTTIPDLASLYFTFERYLETEAAESVKAINLYRDTRIGLESLRRWLAEQVLRQPCSPKQAKPVLFIWKDPTLYQLYLGRMLRRWEEGFETKAGLALLSDMYSSYRNLDGVETPVPILRKMFEFYYPSDQAGLAEVYRDWHDSWGDLDQWGYEKFMKFYSACGDVKAVKDLWVRYTRQFPAVVKQPLGFRSTLNVFAQAGDVEGAEKEFETMTKQYGVKPDIDSWNTLLKCYSKADSQSRAFKCFDEIKQVDRPDAFTYAQVMAMAAKRGDLATVVKYFDESQKDGISVSREMALSLVMAYCHNDRLRDAEKICVGFSERNATSTVVWNQLLYFNGQKGDLSKCFEVLKLMKKYNVEWNHQTHEYLLQAMVHVDQVEQAFQLLRNARDDGLFPVGPEHFAMVMSGAVRTGHLSLAESIFSHMRSAGFGVPLKAHVSLVQMAVRQNPSAERTRTLANDVVNHVVDMLTAITKTPAAPASSAKSSSWTRPSGLLELKRQSAVVGRTILLLVELRDYRAIERLMSSYVKAFPEQNEKKSFPPEIAAALMLGYLKDGKLEGVQRMWKQTWEGAVASSTRGPGAGIYPAYQYDLARPLDVAIAAFAEARDGAGLLKTIEHVLDSGFKLTRTNWNLAIRHLADLGYWERAMEWCEKMLMTQWRGWTPSAPSVEARRDTKSNRVLVASRSTVFSLQREWLKLRKLAAWSGGISSKLKAMEQQHPRLHHAFITTDYEHLVATWVIPRKKSMTRAIKDLLRPLSHDELKAMRNALEKQLRLEKRLVKRSRHHSPFHVVVGRGTMRDRRLSEVITRGINPREAQKLDVLLKAREDELV